MADEKVPLVPPPSYEDAAAQHSPKGPQKPHGRLPVRPPAPRQALDLPALTSLQGRRVILASASPRRKQLLAQIGIHDVEIIPSTAPEDKPKSLSPFEYVLQTAETKAMTVYRAEIDSPKGEPALVIAADTIVVSVVGEILEKPRSEREHVAVLKGLRDAGNHKVYTAVVVMAPREDAAHPGYAVQTVVEETTVRFDTTVTDELIMAYVKTREGADKAGGYGIQGMGAVLVEKIDGTHDNVVGLPLRATLQLIEKCISESTADPAEGADSDEDQ